MGHALHNGTLCRRLCAWLVLQGVLPLQAAPLPPAPPRPPLASPAASSSAVVPTAAEALAQPRPQFSPRDLLPRPSLAASVPASMSYPPTAAQPGLIDGLRCAPLQRAVEAILATDPGRWGVTLVDGSGRLLADHRGSDALIPASNQKLISTAIAIDRLGPGHRLHTSLWRLPDGRYRLQGSGDPFLTQSQIQHFAMLAVRDGLRFGEMVPNLDLPELPRGHWWPSGWPLDDRQWEYAAPVTLLSVAANSEGDFAVQDPPAKISRLLRQGALAAGGALDVTPVSAARTRLSRGSRRIHAVASPPLSQLITRANNRSHNVTAEVLLRIGGRSWDLRTARRRALVWLRQRGLWHRGLTVADGSGLDRANRASSRFFTALLLHMHRHPHSTTWFGSLARAGQTGTLKYSYAESPLKGRFVAKTGTLRGVRTMSGRLNTPGGPIFFSFLANGAENPSELMEALLTRADSLASCGPQPDQRRSDKSTPRSIRQRLPGLR